jgi:uncharacterized protein YkwD
MVTVVLLALGALGVATPALLPNADAAPVDTSAQPTMVHTPSLLSGEPPSPAPADSPAPGPESPAPADPPPPEPSEPPAVEPPPAGRPGDEVPAPRPDARPQADVAAEKRVLALVNQRRKAAGCASIRSNYRLVRAAYLHSKDMAAKDYFSHTGANGSTPWDRAEAAGYKRANAENLAAGQQTAETVVKAWMDSPAHRANLLDCDSRAMGVALARGGSYGIYWTQMFGTA